MRKITEKSVNAFFKGKNFQQGNTEVIKICGLSCWGNDKDIIFNLHGNTIARLTDNQTKLIINHCGWLTSTTKERLNGILSAYGLGYIQQQKKHFYYKHGKKVINMGDVTNTNTSLHQPFEIVLKPEKIYVTMTDRFMSGWGCAENLINKYIIVCDNLKQASIIEMNAHKRNEMKYINIRFSTPNYGNGYLSSYENFNELGEIWTKGKLDY